MKTKIGNENSDEKDKKGFSKFCEETSLPGWSYLNFDICKFWKLLWIIFLCLAVCLSVLVVIVNVQQYIQVCERKEGIKERKKLRKKRKKKKKKKERKEKETNKRNEQTKKKEIRAKG